MSEAASLAELEALRLRLAEAEQALAAIRGGEVDALVVEGPEGRRIYALEEERNHFRALVEELAEGAATLSAGGAVCYCNRRFAELLGVPLERAMGAVLRDLVAPATRVAFDRLLAGAAGGAAKADVAFLRPAGEPLPVQLSVSLTRDAAPVLCVVATDLSERRGAAERLLEAQKMEAVGRLAGGVAHDFNNLLTVILSGVDLLALDEAVAASPQAAEDLGTIREASQRARQLTRQLLAFARRQVLHAAPVDLGAIAAGAEKLLRRLLTEDIALEVRAAPGLWPVLADPAQLEQVLFNLVVNARDAMPNGGHLVVEAGNATLAAPAAVSGVELPAGDYVRLAVRDDGVGMPAEVLAHAFEPFFSTKPRGLGTGLGLATVHGIVRQAGGAVRAESRVGAGCVIEVLLPRHAGAEADAGGAGAEAEAAPGGDERVVLAEDEAPVRLMTSRALRAAGYTVLEAADGAEALALLEREGGRVAMVVTDAVMPRMNGRELTEAVRARWPAVKVLMVSGHAHDVLAHRDIMGAGLQFLEKPFTPAELCRAVRTVLDGRG